MKLQRVSRPIAFGQTKHTGNEFATWLHQELGLKPNATRAEQEAAWQAFGSPARGVILGNRDMIGPLLEQMDKALVREIGDRLKGKEFTLPQFEAELANIQAELEKQRSDIQKELMAFDKRHYPVKWAYKQVQRVVASWLPWRRGK